MHMPETKSEKTKVRIRDIQNLMLPVVEELAVLLRKQFPMLSEQTRCDIIAEELATAVFQALHKCPTREDVTQALINIERRCTAQLS